MGRVCRNILTILGTILYNGGILAFAHLIFVPRDPAIRLFTGITTLLLAAIAVDVVVFLHYLAPLIVAGTLLSLVLERIRRLRKVREPRTGGRTGQEKSILFPTIP
jgi:hypothetical protein